MGDTPFAKPQTAWIITSGAPGHELPCIGLCNALGITNPKIFRVTPGWLQRQLAPRGDAKLSNDMSSPWPDLVICSTRQGAPYGRKLRPAINQNGGKVVFLQNPVISPSHFDLVWAPLHDNLTGANVFSTITAPHHLTYDALTVNAEKFKSSYFKQAKRNIGIILGGPSKVVKYKISDVDLLIKRLMMLSDNADNHLMICASRRTPAWVLDKMTAIFKPKGHAIWQPHEPNPYKGILGLADALIVTSDSVNMVGEALFTKKPTAVFRFSDTRGKFDLFLNTLFADTAIEWFEGQVPSLKTDITNATDEIAKKVRELYR